MDDQKNTCMICGVDMGDCNPRQYCCKTYCPEDTQQSQSDDVQLDDIPLNDDVQSDDISMNKCIVCGIDMGECNPRQYCCKTYCPAESIML